MIASPYAIPSSKKAVEVTGTPYYVPPPKTVNNTRHHNDSGSSRIMGISRAPSRDTSSRDTSSSSTGSASTSYSSSDSSASTSSTSSVIYVPVTTSTTTTPVKPFGVIDNPPAPVTPTFSVGMKNDKRK